MKTLLFCLSSLLILTSCNQQSEFAQKTSLASSSEVSEPQPGAVLIPDPGTVSNPDPGTVSNPNPGTVSNPDPGTVTNPNPGTVSNPDPGTVTNPNPGTVSNPDPGTVTNPNPGTVSNPDPGTVSNPDPGTVSNPDPGTGPGTGSNPVALPGAKKCNYSFSATHVDNMVQVTVIAGPQSVLSNLDNDDLDKLPAEDKAFITDALAKKLQAPVVSEKQATTQTVSEKLIIQNAQKAEASFTNLKGNLKLQYALKGEEASIKGTSILKGSKVFALLDGKQGSVDFTNIGYGAQIFLVFITQGNYVSCVTTTGVEGNMHFYSFAEQGKTVQSQMKATAIKASSLIQQVSGGANTVGLIDGTSITNSHVDVTVIGEANTVSSSQFTGLGTGNKFNYKVRGKENSKLSLQGTYAGKDTEVQVDVLGTNNPSAKFSFTDASDIHIKGSIKGVSPVLDLNDKLKESKRALIQVNLE